MQYVRHLAQAGHAQAQRVLLYPAGGKMLKKMDFLCVPDVLSVAGGGEKIEPRDAKAPESTKISPS
jgi:hypothetical protein